MEHNLELVTLDWLTIALWHTLVEDGLKNCCWNGSNCRFVSWFVASGLSRDVS